MTMEELAAIAYELGKEAEETGYVSPADGRWVDPNRSAREAIRTLAIYFSHRYPLVWDAEVFFAAANIDEFGQ